MNRVTGTSGPAAQPEPPRRGQIRPGIWIEPVTIVWMTIEASRCVSPLALLPEAFHSKALGLIVSLELIAGGILLWRLLVEQRGGSHKACLLVTVISLFALAIYIGSDKTTPVVMR